MNKIFFFILFAAAAAGSVLAQSPDDRKAAVAVVETMFAEMANHNPAGIVGVFQTSGSPLTAIIKRRDGTASIMNLTGETFSKNFAEKKNEIKEVMYEPKALVDGDLAVVSGRYVFFVDGKLSHCGLNAFHLVRTAAGWRIASASSTIDPGSCTEREKQVPVNPVAATAAKQRQFIIVLRLNPKYQDDKNWTAEDNQAVSRHFARLQKLQAEGKLIVAGRTMVRESMGIVVVEVESEAEAAKIMADDDAVKAGIMSAELRPFQTALLKQ